VYTFLVSDAPTTLTLHDATPADLPVIRNLSSYYVYDLSEHTGWSCNPDGRFDGCDDLESYWRTPGRHAFVLRAGEELAGFVLILADGTQPGVDFSVTDFFVMPKFRGRGEGERIARQLFDRFRGRWKVEQFAANKPAVAFWREVIDRYSGGRFEESSTESRSGTLNVLSFNNTDRD